MLFMERRDLPVGSILVTLEQKLLLPDSLNQCRLDRIVVGNKVIGGPVSDIGRNGEVLKVGRNGQERWVVADNDIDLDRRVGAAGEEGVTTSEAEPDGDDLATASGLG
jgi:hypothetical protein